jgi:hypothetical protein
MAMPGAARAAQAEGGAPVGDTTNWEFAAAVAGVVIGLGGLLLFTVIAAVGAWRVFADASRAARESELAALSVQDLSRVMASRSARQLPVLDLQEAASDLAALRHEADALMEQQARLQDAVRDLVETGTLRTPGADQQLGMVMRRLEDNLARLAATIDALGQRD